jgi:hypothetical protein
MRLTGRFTICQAHNNINHSIFPLDLYHRHISSCMSQRPHNSCILKPLKIVLILLLFTQLITNMLQNVVNAAHGAQLHHNLVGNAELTSPLRGN